MDEQTAQTFEAALRDAGASKMLLNQVVMIYQRAFPANAMRPDMRARLHDAIIELAQAGVINVIEEDDAVAGDPLGLPHAIDICGVNDDDSALNVQDLRADALL